MVNKSIGLMEEASERQLKTMQGPYEALQRFNNQMHEQAVNSLKSENIAAKDTSRKAEDEAREALTKTRKAESIVQSREEENEKMEGTVRRIRRQRGELPEELEEAFERYEELVKESSKALPKFGDEPKTPPGLGARSRSPSPRASGTTAAVAATSSTDVDPKISRKESESVNVLSWPKIDQLDLWKGKLLSNVLAACGDPDSDAWSKWLYESFQTSTTVDELSDSGGSRFSGIDSKLVISLEKMIKSAGDQASEVALEIQQLTTRLIKVAKQSKEDRSSTSSWKDSARTTDWTLCSESNTFTN